MTGWWRPISYGSSPPCHVIHTNGSRYTYSWVMSHVWMSHVTHMNESRHPSECVMSLVWKSHVARMTQSCHKYEWVMSHMNESCHTWMNHVTHINVSFVTHDSFMCVTHVWVTHEWHMSDTWVKHMNESHTIHSCVSLMGCLIFVGHFPQKRPSTYKAL